MLTEIQVSGRPFGLVVSDADYCTVGTEFESLGEDMDVCKCIVSSRHGGTLNSRRAASPLVCLVEGEERWVASDNLPSVLPLNWGGPSHIVLSPVRCSKLQLMTGVT
ncbi:uncharacterized protein TNCV_178881 [Trichonephila clavipes]|nr:uncharacterized protein TNCV_178881 [Trichonephila clavipes]